jgi:hypothetical protein
MEFLANFKYHSSVPLVFMDAFATKRMSFAKHPERSVGHLPGSVSSKL